MKPRIAIIGAGMGGLTAAIRLAQTSWEIGVLRRFGWNRFLLAHFPRLIFYRALTTFLPRNSSLTEDVRADLWQSFYRADVRKYISKMCAGYQGTLHHLSEIYSRISCPTLILWSENDKHFPLVHAEKLRAVIPGSILHAIPQATHWVFWHDPETVIENLLHFLPDA